MYCRYNGDIGDVIVGRIIEVRAIEPFMLVPPISLSLHSKGSTKKMEGGN